MCSFFILLRIIQTTVYIYTCKEEPETSHINYYDFMLTSTLHKIINIRDQTNMHKICEKIKNKFKSQFKIQNKYLRDMRDFLIDFLNRYVQYFQAKEKIIDACNLISKFIESEEFVYNYNYIQLNVKSNQQNSKRETVNNVQINNFEKNFKKIEYTDEILINTENQKTIVNMNSSGSISNEPNIYEPVDNTYCNSNFIIDQTKESLSFKNICKYCFVKVIVNFIKAHVHKISFETFLQLLTSIYVAKFHEEKNSLDVNNYNNQPVIKFNTFDLKNVQPKNEMMRNLYRLDDNSYAYYDFSFYMLSVFYKYLIKERVVYRDYDLIPSIKFYNFAQLFFPDYFYNMKNILDIAINLPKNIYPQFFDINIDHKGLRDLFLVLNSTKKLVGNERKKYQNIMCGEINSIQKFKLVFLLRKQFTDFMNKLFINGVENLK